MAKKRLNKKLLMILALVGMAVVATGVIMVVQYKFRDPQPYLDTARELVAKARQIEEAIRAETAQIEDPQEAYEYLKEQREERTAKLWKGAHEAFASAYKNSRRNQQLAMETLKDFGQMKWETGKYTEAVQTWNTMLKREGSNYFARRKIAEFFYERAQYSLPRQWNATWSEVDTQADHLIQLNSEEAYGYNLKAHAAIMLLSAGVVENPEETIAQTEELLHRSLELEPDNLLTHNLLAQVELAKAKRSEDEQEAQAYRDKAESYLREGIARNPDDSEGYVNLYQGYFLEEVRRQFNAARAALQESRRAQIEWEFAQERGTTATMTEQELKNIEEQTQARAAESERLKAAAENFWTPCLQELDEIISRFPTEGKLYMQGGRLILIRRTDIKALTEALRYFDKALESPEIEESWYLEIARAYELRGIQSEEKRPDLEHSFELLRQGIYIPAVMEKKGPRETHLMILRLELIQDLIDICVRLAHLSEDQQARDNYLAVGEKFLGELQDAVGIDHSACKASAGILALEQGNYNEGVRDLYQADEMLTVSGAPNAALKWKLFEALRGTEHHSAAVNYALEALLSGMRAPVYDTEYIEAALELPLQSELPVLLQMTKVYDEMYPEDDTYIQKMKLLRAQILVRQGKREEAAEALSEYKGPPNVLQRRLEAQIQEKMEDRVKGLEEILEDEPGNGRILASLFSYYLSQGTKDPTYYERARSMLERALKVDEENENFQRMYLILQEPDPNNISEERNREITRTILMNIKDEFERENSLGKYYQRLANEEKDREGETARQYREQAKAHFSAAQKIKPDDISSYAGLFDLAVAEEDWAKAEQILGKVSEIDQVMSLLFEGNLKAVRQEWADAANRLEEYLKERPISYSVRASLAQIYRQMGNYDEAIIQANTALQQNSSDLQIHRLLLTLMHQRNQEEGIDNTPLARVNKLILAANRYLRVARNDSNIKRLKVMYYPLWISHRMKQYRTEQGISEKAKTQLKELIEQAFQEAVRICRILIAEEPQEALNWKIYSGVIYQYAKEVDDATRSRELMAQLEQVYQQALKSIPGESELTELYASFLQEIGRGKEAEQLMSQAMGDMTAEERYSAQLRIAQRYMQQKNYGRARQLIDQVLAEDNLNRPAGLLLAEWCVQTGNLEGAIYLIERLRLQEDSDILHARHVELLLNAGQYEKAAELLEELKSKYPEYKGTMLLQSRLEMRNANYAAAVAYADRILMSNPEFRPAYLLKAESLYYDRKYREALECITVLRNMVGSESNAGRIILARTYWALARRDEAINELRAGLRVEADNIPIRKNLISYLRRDNRWNDLVEFYKESIKLFANSIDLRLEAAEAIMYRGDQLKENNQPRQAMRQYEQALEWIKEAGDLSQQFEGKGQMDILARYLSLLLKAENYQAALQMAERNLKANPDNVALLMSKSEAQYQLGKKMGNVVMKREALKTFERALELVSDNPNLSNIVLGYVTRVGDAEEVIAWSKAKLGERPDWKEIHLVLAKLYRGQERHAEEIEELLAAQKESGEELSMLIEQFLSIAYQKNNQRDEAVACYRRLLEKQPDNKGLINNLAYTLLQQGGHTDEAVELAEKAYDLDRNDTDIMDTYALALLEKQDYGQAELIMRRAIQQLEREVEEVNAEFHYHLGQALMGQGRNEAARGRMETALDQIASGKVGPGGELLREKITADLEAMEMN